MTVRMVATIKRFIGLSTDIKPVDDIAKDRVGDGSTFLESDTGDMYSYAGGNWTLKEEANIKLRLEVFKRFDNLLEEVKKTNENLMLVIEALDG